MSIQSFACTVGMSNNMDQPYIKDITAITNNTGGLPCCSICNRAVIYMIGLNCLHHNILYLHCFVIIKVATGELSFLFHSVEMRQLLFNYCT